MSDVPLDKAERVRQKKETAVRMCRMCFVYGDFFTPRGDDCIDTNFINECFMMKGRKDPNRAQAYECILLSDLSKLPREKQWQKKRVKKRRVKKKD